VLLHTGWSRRVGAEGFLNVGPDGPHSPGFHKETILFLIEERDILGVGVETVARTPARPARSIPPSPPTPLLHGASKFGLASLRNLDQLPPTGAVVIAAPLKIVHGSGSPLRVLALVE
jgi:kynurenine formamidase